ncbi:MAG TPA: hypothetical protein VF719_07010 [Abditibacteriaceae bacterium]|jgi:hypothetical protein
MKFAPFAIVVLLLSAFSQGHAQNTSRARSSISVAGVACKTDNALWREGLVGFGLRGLVAQSIYNYRRFDIIEEDPFVLGILRRHSGAAKTDSSDSAGPSAAPSSLLPDTQADWVIIGEVETFNALGQGTGAAVFVPRPMPRGMGGQTTPMGRTTVTATTIKVNLRAFDAHTKRLVAEKHGEGKATYKQSLLFTNQTLPFMPSLVGPALKIAVKNAVADLMRELPSQSEQLLPGAPSSIKTNEPVSIAMLPLALNPEIGEAYPVLRKRRVALGLQSVLQLAVRNDARYQLLDIDPELQKITAEQWEIGRTPAPVPGVESVHTPTVQAEPTAPESPVNPPVALSPVVWGETTTLPDQGQDAVLLQGSEPQTPRENVATKNNVRWLIYAEVFAFSRSVGETGLSIKGKNIMSVGIQLRAVDPSAAVPRCRISSAVAEASGDWKDWNWSQDGADINWKQDLVGQATQSAMSQAWTELANELAQ